MSDLADNTTSDQEQLDELCHVARQMGEAEKNRNQEFFKALLAEKLIFRRASGAIVDKETFLTDLQNPANTYEILKQRDVVAHVYEDVGVVTLLVQAKGMREEKRFDGVFRNIRIFVHERDKEPRWQLHSWFNVRIP